MGVAAAQCFGNDRIHTIGIAEHLVIPEAQESVSFPLDQRRPLGIPFLAMLPAIDLDDQPRLVTCEVGDETADWHLAAKTGVGETFSK